MKGLGGDGQPLLSIHACYKQARSVQSTYSAGSLRAHCLNGVLALYEATCHLCGWSGAADGSLNSFQTRHYRNCDWACNELGHSQEGRGLLPGPPGSGCRWRELF